MTDNTKQTANQEPTKKPVQEPTKKSDQKLDTETANNDSTKLTAQNNSQLDKQPEPQMKKVNIVIAGITYQIYCPVNGEEELRAAVYYINNFLLDIKKEAPRLSQEHLLVLCCLNLYEKIHANNKTNEANKQQSLQTEAMLSNIIKEAQSIL